MSKYFICLDIGGTKVLGAIFNNKREIVYRIKKKTKADGDDAQNIENTIISLVEELVEGFKISLDDVAAIAAGAPGVINIEKGVVLFSPNLPWRNYEIKKAIEEKFHVPFFIGNDVNVGVYGEWKYGAAKDLKQVVGLFVGTGMGAGLILDGKLFTGYQDKGAECGHMILDPEGPKCNCGQRGCLEAFSSKQGISDYIRTQAQRGRATSMEKAVAKGVFKSKALKAAYEEGDEVAIEAIDRACHYLAIGIGNLINTFSPEMVVLGGGVMEAMNEVFMEKILKEVDRYCMPSIRDTVAIKAAALGDDSILYGALAMIDDMLKD
ncbi:MAG: ROK family protein [Clostridiales bacterium]|nr:ROK family protein [Candidatus Scatonaster coprocaballi]